MRAPRAWIALCLSLFTSCILIPCGAESKQRAVASVSSQEQLVKALRDPSVEFIILQKGVKLGGHNYRVQLDRNLTISGPLATPLYGTAVQDLATAAPAPAAPAVSLDVSFERGLLFVGPGVLLVLQNLVLLGSAVQWDPGLAFIHHAPAARVRLQNVVRSNPMCPQSMEWLRLGLQSTPLPPHYTPPAHLYNPVTQGPFANEMNVWNRTECQQRWLFPETCAEAGGFTRQMAYEMPGRPDNRLAFDYSVTMGIYEYFNVSFPCGGYINQKCVERKGYPACFNKRMVWILRRYKLEQNIGQIGLGALVAAAAVGFSFAWWQQQLQEQQRQQQQLQQQGGSSQQGGSGTLQLPVAPVIPVAEMTTGAGVFQYVTFGSLIGAGSYGRVYEADWQGKPVAVKVMEVQRSKDLRSARHELDINMMLQHANVVTCYDYQIRPQAPHSFSGYKPSKSTAGAAATTSTITFGSKSDLLSSSSGSMGGGNVDADPTGPLVQVLLLMERCDCGSLRSAITAGLLRRHVSGQISCFNNMVSVLRIALDIARGMQHLHQHNVCHGDLCSNNVLLCSSDKVPPPLGVVAKVADFGLSRLLPDQGTHLSTVTHGTLTHQAPEVLGTGQLRLAADVYSFGVLLWELVHLGTPRTSSSSSSSSLVDSSEQATAAGAAAAPASSGMTDATDSLRSSCGKNYSNTITGVYQQQGEFVNPWVIVNKVLAGMRPVFTAPAVPGPYIALAQRCWDAEPSKRPSFDDIVILLESVVNDGRGAGSDAVGSF